MIVIEALIVAVGQKGQGSQNSLTSDMLFVLNRCTLFRWLTEGSKLH